MAEWWELVIPAGSALVGTVIGAGSQLALRRVQSRHERVLKMYDDRKSLYVRTEAAAENVLDGLRGRPSAGAGHEARQAWFDEFLPVYEELAAAARLVRLIGSGQVVAAVERMTLAARRDTGPEAFVALRSAFVEAARGDLGAA
jgi:hypothetical protein